MAGLCFPGVDYGEFSASKSQGRIAQKAAAIMIEFFGHFDKTHW
jgi:hypothetical protein